MVIIISTGQYGVIANKRIPHTMYNYVYEGYSHRLVRRLTDIGLRWVEH